MIRVTKDISALLALELNYPDIINLCTTHRKFNREICENESFWRNKLNNDFPQAEFTQILREDRMRNKNPKQKYQQLYNDFPNFFLHVSGPKIGEAYLNLSKDFIPQLTEDEQNGVEYSLGFNNPVFIKAEYINFFREADFGRIDDKYGGARVVEILEPLLKYGILTRSILFKLMVIYILQNGLKFVDNGKVYIKVDPLMNHYFDDILTSLENEDANKTDDQLLNRKGRRKLRFNRNKFLFTRLMNVLNKIIIRNSQLNERQQLLIDTRRNPLLLRRINVIKGVLNKFRDDIEPVPQD